jgi:O-antigen/teichoic acid export membrane protein
MKVEKTILKNISALFGAQLITGLLTPVLLIYIARQLGDEVFGKYSYVLALTTIFLLVSEFGIKSVAIRDVARDASDLEKYLSHVFFMKLVISFLSVVVLVLFVNLMNPPRDTTLAAHIFAGGLFFQSMSYAFRWIFHALQIMEYEALQRVLERTLLLVLSVMVILRGYGLIALSFVFLITQIIVFICSIFFAAKKIVIPRIRVDLSFLQYIIKTAIFFALCEVLWIIYFKIDLVMLAKLKGETEVGWYNAAYVIVNFITLISMLSMQAIFPALAHFYKRERDKLRETVEISFRYLLLIVLAVVPALFFFSEKIINLIYGSDYSDSISALKILIFVIIFLFPNNLFAHTLAASNRHKVLSIINLAGVVVNILLNFILIPRFSYMGAGISTIITELMLCFLLYSAMSRFIKIRSSKIILSLLPGLVAMVLIINMASHFPWIPVIVFSLLVYFVSAFLTGGIKREDISLLAGIIKKERPTYSEEIK